MPDYRVIGILKCLGEYNRDYKEVDVELGLFRSCRCLGREL